MEKKSAKISLGTAVCMVVILILIIALAVVYYIGFVRENEKTNLNINSENTNMDVENKVDGIENNINNDIVESRENEFTIVYDALYNSLTEMKNGEKSYSYIVSDNKIEEIIILGIDISKDKYLYGKNWISTEHPEVYSDDNLIIGTCEYGLKLDTLEGLMVAGSGDSKHIGNWFIDNKLFIYNKTTQSIELATGI